MRKKALARAAESATTDEDQISIEEEAAQLAKAVSAESLFAGTKER
jgi:hypothetical protein